MNIKQLQYFIDLSETLNFTQTAKNSYISQTAITKQIHNLEEELQLTLFYRNKKTVQLTQEGQMFLPFAKKIIYDYYLSFQAISQYRRGEKGNVKIGYIKNIDYNFLLALFNQIQSSYPHIHFEFLLLSKEELISSFVKKDIDAMICYGKESSYHATLLKEYQLKKYYKKGEKLESLPLLYDVREITPQKEEDIEQLLLKICLKEGYAILHDYIEESSYYKYLSSHYINEKSNLYFYTHFDTTNQSIPLIIDKIKEETLSLPNPESLFG